MMKTPNCKSWMNPGFATILFGLATLSGTAQSFDTSATGTVKGDYFVRQVLVIPDGITSAIIRAVSLIGTMNFNGAGTYTFSGQLLDSRSGTPQQFSTSGGYGVSANGFFQCANPIHNFIVPSASVQDIEYGAIGAIGPTAIVASSTETASGYNDIFVAIPAGNGVTNGSIQGTYRAGYIDFLQNNASQVRDSYFALASNGSGSFGTVAVTGAMANQGSTSTTQNMAVTYNVALPAGSGTIAFPVSATPLTTLISGQKTFYLSADSNIILAGSPSGFDLMVAVKAISGAANATFQGTYFTTAIENGIFSSGNNIDSYYGSTNSNGQGTAIKHLRLAPYFAPPYDLTYDLNYNMGSDGTFNGELQYLFGAGGQAFVAVGTGSYYALTVGFKAIQYPTTTVFLNPLGVVNAATFAPVTNSVAPGEYVALFGSNLAAATVIAPTFPLQTTLGGVQVTVNGSAAPIYFVSSGQINFLMPFSTKPLSFATIQVSNNGIKSNPITVYTAASAPGVLTQPGNGVGPAKVTHLDGSLVTQANPATAGETLVLYAIGLGAVLPAVSDGAAAPTSPLSIVQDTNVLVEVTDQNFKSYSTTLLFKGLTPGFPNLYQLNFTLPSGANAPPKGQLWVNINTTDAYTSEAKIFVQ